MGEKKRRIQYFDAPIKPIIAYINAYQHSLRALLKSAPEDRQVAVPEIATVGQVAVWPCSDGAVVIIYRNEQIQVNVKQPLKRKVNEFLQHAEAAQYYDQASRPSKLRAVFQIRDASNLMLHSAGYIIQEGGREFRPKYQRLTVIGWKVQLPMPDEEALKDFRDAFAAVNIVGPRVASLPQPEVIAAVETGAHKILNEFRELLASADLEEDLQVYLKNHPELLYPDFIECHPKFKRGDDYVTDYALKVQGQSGPEYVFVEIERPSKPLFTKSGQFSADLTQAKDQLLDWEKWLNINHAYVTNKLPGLYKPQFHLVMGRTEDLSKEKTEKIRTEYSGTHRRFSTYDDLATRFEQIMKQVVRKD